MKQLLRWGYHRLPLPAGSKQALRRQLLLLPTRWRRRRVAKPWLPTIAPGQDGLNAAIASLHFSTTSAAEPEISVIVPCYDQLRTTVACLLSLQAHPPSRSWELLLLDDGSPNDDYGLLASVPGLRLIRQHQNLGFLDSCNAAAAQAHGRHLLLLNNDTIVQAGSLDALRDTFEQQRRAGLVGARLIDAEGQLQEAGGLVWRDGSACNVGRLQDPSRPEFNHLRRVDYCSGAAIMLPTDLFRQLGGFDPAFRPAYYEDTDLAMRVRAAGREVLYQPAAVVVHHEGVSHGTDPGQGLKRHQVLNQERFRERWADALQQHAPPGEHSGLERWRELNRGFAYRALLIDQSIPSPDRDAGSVCLLNLMLLLRDLNVQPSLIAAAEPAPVAGTALCERLGIECLHGPHVRSIHSHLRRHGSHYDLVLVFRPELAQVHLEAARRHCPQARLIYYPHDLHYLRWGREAALHNDQSLARRAERSRRQEWANSRQADSTIVLSRQEQEALQRALPQQRIDRLPLMLSRSDNAALQPRFGGRHLVFVGNFRHGPNADAVLWFAEAVLPLLLPNLPDLTLHVVGQEPPEAIRRLQGPCLQVHGFVDDLEGLLARMQVAVLPLRYGAGMKGKLGTALRQGLPVVSTSIGCEGLPAQESPPLLVADSAEAFAAAVMQLLNDQTTWERFSAIGAAFAAREWGPEASRQTLASILSGLGLEASRLNAWPSPDLRLYPF